MLVCFRNSLHGELNCNTLVLTWVDKWTTVEVHEELSRPAQ
jgi:hypothetical protein